MAIGDHLEVNFGCYFHHGIEVDDGHVVHFGRGLHDIHNARIERVTREEFSRDEIGQERKVKVLDYDCRFTPEEVASRAISQIGQGDYRLFGNNCEDFAYWCRTGEKVSFQTSAIYSCFRQLAAVAAKPALARKLAGSVLAAGPLPEAVQVATEMLVWRWTRSLKQGQMLGKATGATTAAVVGLLKVGPVGAVSSTTVYLSGQVVGERLADQGTRCLESFVRCWQRKPPGP